MKKLIPILPAILAMGAAQPPAQQLAFVTCPIIRDTSTVPCWLAEYEGELYYLVIQQDVGAPIFPPQLGHQALIEGTPTSERICGGLVMEDLHISVRPELDASCNRFIPASDEYTIDFNPRGPGPSNARSGPNPGANGAAPPRPRPTPPPIEVDGPRTFEVQYLFDAETAGRGTRDISAAAAYAQAAGEGAKITITGHRAAVRLSDGEILGEVPHIAERRAKELRETLVVLGVPRNGIEVAWENEAEEGDYTRRRSVIEVTP